MNHLCILDIGWQPLDISFPSRDFFVYQTWIQNIFFKKLDCVQYYILKSPASPRVGGVPCLYFTNSQIDFIKELVRPLDR
jgi:hypothetical protein